MASGLLVRRVLEPCYLSIDDSRVPATQRLTDCWEYAISGSIFGPCTLLLRYLNYCWSATKNEVHCWCAAKSWGTSTMDSGHDGSGNVEAPQLCGKDWKRARPSGSEG